MIVLTLQNVNFGIENRPDGSKLVAFVDPQSGIEVHVPFSPDGAERFRQQLAGIVIASQLPPNGDQPR